MNLFTADVDLLQQYQESFRHTRTIFAHVKTAGKIPDIFHKRCNGNVPGEFAPSCHGREILPEYLAADPEIDTLLVKRA